MVQSSVHNYYNKANTKHYEYFDIRQNGEADEHEGVKMVLVSIEWFYFLEYQMR